MKWLKLGSKGISVSFCSVVVLLGLHHPVYADSAGLRETRAVEVCLNDYPTSEHQCFDVAYYTCMGEQIELAANPSLARERCLFQEMFVWSDLLEDGCAEMKNIFEEGSTEWDAVCFNNNAPNWSYLTNLIAPSEYDRGFPDHSLVTTVVGIRSNTVQIRHLLRAVHANGLREEID